MTKQKLITQKSGVSDQFPFWFSNTRVHYIILALVALVLYSNTFQHDYTQDDAIVIYDNMFTTQGIKGIPGIFSNDSFFGFFKDKSKATLVEGGRYRPFTLAMFAIEYQLFGRSPMAGHILNVIWYILLSFMIYIFCTLLFKEFPYIKHVSIFAFLVSLLFLAHPVHTEVVANIKGRDEIMSLFFSVTSFIFIIRFIDSNALKDLIIACIIFFAGLLSKENTITFLAVIPAGLMLFRQIPLRKSFLSIIPLLGVSIIFIWIRYTILGAGPVQTGIRDLMNDPFIKWTGSNYVPLDWGEKYATVSFTLGKYLQLLIFPHPLTHDYYPRQIPIMRWMDWQVIVSLMSYILLICWTAIGLKKQKVASFSIFYFVATLSIVSNILFPVGTNMAERFLFMPSLAFSLLSGLGVYILFHRGYLKMAWLILILITGAYTWKTIDRNRVWKNDYTLFTTDVQTSVNSAKVLNAAGGALSTSVVNLEDEIERNRRLEKAIGYLTRAIEIHPRYRNAYLLLGNCYYYTQDFPKAIAYYDETLKISPGYTDAIKNRRNVYRDAGRYYGEKMGDLNQALFYLKKAYEEMPEDIETIRLLGVCYGLMQNHDEAISLFRKWTVLNPENAFAWKNLMAAYGAKGDETQAALARAKAISLDPEIMNK